MGTAMRGLDELIGFLLEEISLRGEQGATPSEIRGLVDLFYQPHGIRSTDGDVNSHAQNDGDAAKYPQNRQPLVDSRLLERVWSWLIVHKDISVKNRKKVVANPVRSEGSSIAPTGSLASSSNIQNEEEVVRQNDSQNEQHIGSVEEDLVLRTTEERMWHALTGHGVDYKRIPVMEFTLLSMIGAAGPRGIRQPDLVLLSGQDKRSLPHRTDELKRKGYIEKKQIRLTAHASSLCTLRKFVVAHDKLDTAEAVKDWDSPDVLFKEVFDGGFLDSLKFLDIALRILKEAGTMSAETFRKRLGLTKKLWERRASNTLLRYLEAIGCVRRFHKQSQGLIIKSTLLRSITYLQHPDLEGRAKYATLAKRDARYYTKRKLHAAITEAVEDAGQSDLDAEDSDTPAEPNEVLQLATSFTDSILKPRLSPRWDPERPLLNILYQVADEHGPKGISSMEYASLAGGDFWKRPLDHTLAHLTDIWQESQPPHLRHLTIVRDTAMTRSLHYQYRTYDNFNIAVEEGEVSWDAVDNGNQATNKKAHGSAQAATEETADSWGFPILKNALVFGRDGIATPLECRRVFRFDAEKEKSSNIRDYGIKKPRAYQRRLQEHSTDNPSSPHKQYPTDHDMFKRLRFRNPNAKIPKQDAIFESRCRKLAEYIARQEMKPPNTGKAPVLRAPAPTVSKRGRPKKKVKLTDDYTTEVIPVPVAGTAESSVSVAIADVEQVPYPVTEDAVNHCTDGQNTPSVKRCAPVDSEESRPSKMQKSSTPDDTLDDPRFEARAGQIELELLAMSRPGIYVNPPHRMERTRGRPLKRLVVVVKHKGLHALAWFGPSMDTGLSANLVIEQMNPEQRGQTPPTLPTVISSIPNEPEPHRKRKYPQPRVQKSTAKTARQLPSVHVHPEPRTIRPMRPRQKVRFDESNADNANIITASLNKDNTIRDEALLTKSATSSPLQPTLESVIKPAELTATVPMQVGRSSSLNSDSGKMDRDNSMTTVDAADMTPNSMLPTDVISQLNLAYDDFPTSSKTGLDPMIATSMSQECGAYSQEHRVAPDADHNPDSVLLSTSVTQLDPQTSSTLIRNGASELNRELEQQLDQPNEIRAVIVGSTVSPSNPPSNLLLADGERSRKRYAYKRKSGVLLGAGTLNLKRSQIIMKIIEQAGGVFPGNRELWYPFVVAVRKIEPTSKPDPNTVGRAVKNLVSFGKVRKIAFAFSDRGGAMHTRHILILPNISVESDIVKATQREVIEHFPKPFVPREVEIDPMYRDQWDKEQIRRKMRDKTAADQAAAEERAVRRAALKQVAIDPVDDFIDGITGANNASMENDSRKRKKPGPRRGAKRSIFDEKLSASEPAWRRWALEANVEGARDMLRHASLGNGNKEDLVMQQEEEDDVSEEQAALQSIFTLDRYTHDHETVKQDVGAGRSTRYQKLHAWNQHDKPMARFDDNNLVTLQRYNSTEFRSPPRSGYSSEFNTFARPGFTSQLNNRRNAPELQSNVMVNPKAWIAGSIFKAATGTQILPLSKPQPMAMLFSFSEAQQIRAAKRMMNLEESNAPLRMTTDPFIQQLPQLSRSLGPCLTLTDPDQVLHAPTGTFSTQCAVVRRQRPQLSINPHLQRNFEETLLSSLELVAPRVKDGSSPSPTLRRSSFDSEINRIEEWEIRNVKLLTSRNSLIQPHFINHTISSDVAEQVPWMTLDYKRLGMGRGSKRNTVYQPRSKSLIKSPSYNTRSCGFSQHAPELLAEGKMQPKAVSSTSKAAGRNIRGPRNTTLFSEAQLQRFITAVVVVRSLIGGNGIVIKWTIVQRLMPEYDRALLKQRWAAVRVSHKPQVKRVESEFHEAFLIAYENGLVPRIDYDKIDEYDWDSVMTWAKERMVMSVGSLVLELPANRKQLDRTHLIQDVPKAMDFSKDDLHVPVLTDVRREGLMHNFSFSLPFDKTRNSKVNYQASVQDIARSYVRANTFTPEASYNAQDAKQKLVPFGVDVLETAISTLLNAKIFKQENKGRPTPGRNYGISEHFNYAFRRQFDIPLMFHNAVKAKFRIDTDIEINGHSDVSYFAQDADVLVVMNLLAANRIKLQTMIPPITSDASVPAKDPKTGERTLSVWDSPKATRPYLWTVTP